MDLVRFRGLGSALKMEFWGKDGWLPTGLVRFMSEH